MRAVQKIIQLIYCCLVPDPDSNRWVSFSVLALMSISILMLTSVYGGQLMGNLRGIITASAKQVIIMIGGWILYCLSSRTFSVKGISQGRLIPNLCLIYLAVLAVTAYAGTSQGGATAWIYLGPLSLQPFEFGKPLTILLWTSWVYKLRKHAAKGYAVRPFKDFGFPLSFALLQAGILFWQKDIGTMLITLGIAACCWLVPAYSGMRQAQRRALILAGTVLALFVVVLYGTNWIETILPRINGGAYIADRIQNMKNPYLDIYNEGMQPSSGLYALAKGGLWGNWFEGSIQKYGFLSQSESDYIIAIICEETGLIGLSVISVLYGVIFFNLTNAAQRIRRNAGKVLLAGTGAYLMLHYFVNIGGVSMLIPMTGVPLLLVSAGGSSVFAFCIALGCSQREIARLNAPGKSSYVPLVMPMIRFFGNILKGSSPKQISNNRH